MTRTRRRHTAAALTLLMASCGSTCAPESQDRAVRSALDAFNLAGSTAWAGVNEGCIYRQQAIDAEAVARRITTDEARAQLVPVRARCHALTALFQRMRSAHDQAADLVDAGKVDEARVWLEKLREHWRSASELEAASADAGAPVDDPHPVVTQLDGGAP